MNDVTSRASALKALIESGSASAPAQQPFAEAVVTCCMDLIYAGEVDLSLSLANSAAFMAECSGPVWKVRFEVVRARALRAMGMFEDSLAITLDMLANQADHLRQHRTEFFELRINEAANLMQLNRADEAIEKLLGVRSELLASPDSASIAWCAFHLSTAEFLRGNRRHARQFAMEAVVSARRCGNKLVEALGLDNISRLDRALCRWASAEEHVVEALNIFEECGYGFYALIAQRCLGIVHWKHGRLDSALLAANSSIERATRLGSALHLWYASLLKGMIMLHRGSFEEALKLFRSGEDWGIPAAHSRPSLLTTEFLGDIHLETGDALLALRYYDEVWPKALALVPTGDIVAELRRRRAECSYLLGQFADAYAEAKIGLEHCRDLGDRYEEAATYRILGQAAAALGKDQEARDWFEQGFAYFDDIESPYEWGKLWMSYGDWILSRSNRECVNEFEAAEAYCAARDHFGRMGALAKCAEAEARLAKLSMPAPAPAGQEVVSHSGQHSRHSQRRPRGSLEFERKSQWAREQFGLLTRDRAMLHMLEDVAKLARSMTPVLVLGESGTGKELVAHGLHRLSGRSGNFIPINCAALPREIVESELFGHVAGAFTGASRDKPGLLEVCNGGTVFLDEIAEMAVELQARLLRFLETGEVRRVGATRAVSVRTRVVAATNRDRAALERGEGFRTDLYYRLAHAVIELPPLRRRSDDLDLLIDHFLEEICAEEGKQVTISTQARSRLKVFTWPGNVRQLKSAVRRVVILASADHEVHESELQLDDGRAPTTLLEELEQAERRRIADAMRSARGSRTEAAKSLGMPRTTLINKLKRFGLA